MKNDVYLYIRNLAGLKFIRDLKYFVPMYNYDKAELDKMPANEYGLLDFANFRLRILTDNDRDDACPWCRSTDIQIRTETKEDIFNFPVTTMYCECLKCCARGPRHSFLLRQEAEIEHHYDFVKEHWRYRPRFDTDQKEREAVK